jgi:hypothetical protein
MPTVMKNKQLSMKSEKMINAGPSGKMMKGQATGQQKPGVTSQEHSRTKTKGPVKGGNGHMVGKQTVKALKPA